VRSGPILDSVRKEPSGWAHRLLADGNDPDPRVSLANERTFLAWIRTALGLIAVGIGVATFVSTQATKGFAVILAAGLVIIGGAIASVSWFRWLAVERAVRKGAAVPPTRMSPLLAFGVAGLAIIAIIVVVLAA
jgi:putative membrane protein